MRADRVVAQTDVPTVETILGEFLAGVVDATPDVLSGAVFLVLAYLGIRLVLTVARSALGRLYPVEERLIVDLTVTILWIFLWFGVLLAFLKIVGIGDVAVSLGTAGGFIGLGVAFALKEMIADTVAGVYLLRDKDFNHGDRVDTASISGTVERIDLRKTRIRTDDDDLIVLASREVEKKWVKRSPSSASSASAAE